MRIKDTSIRTAAVLLAASVSTALWAQPRFGGGGARDIDIEDLPEERRIPAEQTVALYQDPSWTPPMTSWGVPSLEGTWSTDDMRGIQGNRSQQYGDRELMTQEEFLQRAFSQYQGRDRAVNQETFLRNEWGTRTFGFTSLVVDPPNGRAPATTDAARARQQAFAGRGTFGSGPFDSFEDFSLYDRCISLGLGGGTGALIYGNGIRIAQSPDAVTIIYEMIRETRVIPLDDRPPLDDAIEQYVGSGRGYWDGDTLVIESQNYTSRNGFSAVGGPPSSPNLRTVERLRRVDPEMIEYRITINDPDTYEAPYTIRTMWTTQPNYYMYEYSCHEGNTAVGQGLRSERAFERQVAEAVANGDPIPERSSQGVYGAPPSDARIFNINLGE